MGSVAYNMMARVVQLCLFWGFYYDKSKTFFRGFAAIDNLYIALYRSDVSKHYDVGEHMGVLSPIQFCSADFDDSWMKCFFLVFT